MKRSIWIARAVGIVILLIFTLLMWDLYTKLTRLQRYEREGSRPAGSASAPETR